MRGYGQFCPVARASAVLAERWTPIIVRNLLLGCNTFNEISSGAPGLSRALLTKRLRELERAGVIEIRPKPDRHGSLYELTPSGRELWGVLNTMGTWAQKWMDVTVEDSEADVVLWSWCNAFLKREALPAGRVNVRFEMKVTVGGRTRKLRLWMLIENRDGEICAHDPGFDEDAIVTVDDPVTFARWHLGLVDWNAALRSGAIRVEGRRDVSRALPTWNRGPEIHVMQRHEHPTTDGRNPKVKVDPPAAHRNVVPPPARRRWTTEIDGFGGRLITPGDDDYDGARSVWNGAIDTRPAFIARCADAGDVAAVLRFARDRGLPIATRGGGHSVAGTSVIDDGVVIDMSEMKRIAVDPGARTVRAGAGVRWGELDASTQAFGLATTGGVHSRTGIAGLTLGGGIGHLMRSCGLTIDNLLEVDVVLADGRTVTANADEHPELFWALRGGGGGFGVVTSFTYRLREIGPEVLAGPVIWALEDAPHVLRRYREFVAKAPREVGSGVVLRKLPAFPFLPVELHRRPGIIIPMVSLGPRDAAERAIAPMRTFGRPLIDLVAPRPYVGLQTMLDATAQDGWHYYWKSSNVGPLNDALVDAIVEHSSRVVSPLSYSLITHLGGAVADVAPHATAYGDRSATHNININGVWLGDAESAQRETAWTRAYFADVEPHETSAYLNFMDRDETDRVPDAYGDANHRRLVRIKSTYDPDDVFHTSLTVRSDRAMADAGR